MVFLPLLPLILSCSTSTKNRKQPMVYDIVQKGVFLVLISVHVFRLCSVFRVFFSFFLFFFVFINCAGEGGGNYTALLRRSDGRGNHLGGAGGGGYAASVRFLGIVASQGVLHFLVSRSIGRLVGGVPERTIGSQIGR